jgi:hypothetical protein
MVHIDYKLTYPGITPAEEMRLAQLIKAHLQHYIVTIACTMVKDTTPEKEGEFINSTKLDVEARVAANGVHA